MCSRIRAGMFAVLVAASCCMTGAAQTRAKLPAAERLDRGIAYVRDAATGELRIAAPRAGRSDRRNDRAKRDAPPVPGSSAPTIRSRVSLVEVAVTVREPDGRPATGLRSVDFRVYEDAVEQRIVHADAGTGAAGLALVLDASPSVLREWGQVKEAAHALAGQIAVQDEIAVVAFAGEVELILPWTRDRSMVAQAVDSLEVRRTGERGSKIYEAVYLAAQRLFAERSGRKAILLLTDGQDTGLGLGWGSATGEAAGDRLTFEDVCRALTAMGVEVYVVSTQNRPAAMTQAWLAAKRSETLVGPEARKLEMAHYTVYLAELVRRAGGELYFVREAESLAGVYRRIAEAVGAQYTLGYYSTEGSTRTGWRQLRIAVPSRDGVKVEHRPAYYVPAIP